VNHKIVLIGAGSATFGLETVGNIFKSETLKGSHIVLHDINADALAKVAKLVNQARVIDDLPFTISATTSRREALQGANFCVISIEIGNRFELWEQDWKTPLTLGFKQVFGENGGPGGLFHSLRIIPPVLDICADIDAICPEAIVFNYSNPMTRICLAIGRRFPSLKVVGLCHEIASLRRHLPLILSTPFDNLSFKAGGLNHFSVLLEINYRDSGKDAYPDVRALAPAYFEQAPSPADLFVAKRIHDKEPPSSRSWAGRRLFKEVLERFGYLPITEDSHFGEYISWAYEKADHQEIQEFYDRYKNWSLEEQARTIIDTSDPEEPGTVVPLIEGIVANSNHQEPAVNILNRGFIDNLPSDMVVEVPAMVNEHGVHGISLGELPKGIAGLLNNQVGAIDLAVEAAINGSRDAALQALLVDPVVDSLDRAESLLDTMLTNQAPYLGYLR
jgi:alpha-galactosidase